jgi:hypothetical protein
MLTREFERMRVRENEIYFIFFLIISFSHLLNPSIITRLPSAATLFKEEGNLRKREKESKR